MNNNMVSNNEATMIIKLPEYTLKYDEKTEGLRDKTYSELIKEHGQGNIKCSCMNRVYQISSQFVFNLFWHMMRHCGLTKNEKKRYLLFFFQKKGLY